MKLKKKNSKKKKKIEFSKVLVTIAIIIFTGVAIWSMIEYYILVKRAIELNSINLPDATLPITCITTILGAVLSYCLYQGALKTSLNKNHLAVNNVTGEIQSIMDCDYMEAVKMECEANAEEMEG